MQRQPMHPSVRAAAAGLAVLAFTAGCRAPDSACDAEGGGAGLGVIELSSGRVLGEGQMSAPTEGRVEVWVEGEGDHRVEVCRGGIVDASFRPKALPAVDLGDTPLIVESDLVVDVVDSEPAAGVAYAMLGHPFIHVSDGNGTPLDEPAVSGLDVREGATLTFVPNGFEHADYTFSAGVRNAGVLTMVDDDVPTRPGLTLHIARSYVATGSIEMQGVRPGQHGGWIVLRLGGDLLNHGPWWAHGADSAVGDAGDGGDIFVHQPPTHEGGVFENTAAIVARGGHATGATGSGGSGGSITLGGEFGIRNSADLDVRGGDGIDGDSDLASEGGHVSLMAGVHGDASNAGDVLADGGTQADGFGGRGGRYLIVAYGGDVRSSGDVFVRGGDGAGDVGWGGRGGTVHLRADGGWTDGWRRGRPVPAGDVWLSGSIVATGGDSAVVGGSGGVLAVGSEDEVPTTDRGIHLLGYEWILASGGDASMLGGDGADVIVDACLHCETESGAIRIETGLDVSGGDADPLLAGSVGGAGGAIELIARDVDLRAAFVTGGDGETPGPDGTITP